MDALSAGDPLRIGPYRLVARLGSGGMGRVYLGRSDATGRTAAVKTIHAQLSADDEFRVRFSREANTARRVRDDYIAEVLDADTEGEMPWMATAYVPGISVADAVRNCGALPEESVRLLGVCVARAVAALHAAGLVHRDLKPGNVLLTGAGPKVIDFGIARGLEDANITRTGMVSGSPPYMAPEQLNTGQFGTGSDVFSLAAILHFAATGAGPYGRGGAQEQYARAIAAGPLIDPELPERLREPLERCFAADPDERPAAAELAVLLENSAEEKPGSNWLPTAVLQEILTQATEALNFESAGAAARVPGVNAQAAVPAPAAAPRYTPPNPNQPPPYAAPRHAGQGPGRAQQTPPQQSPLQPNSLRPSPLQPSPLQQSPAPPRPPQRQQPQQPLIPRPTNPPSPPYQTPLPNRGPQDAYPGRAPYPGGGPVSGPGPGQAPVQRPGQTPAQGSYPGRGSYPNGGYPTPPHGGQPQRPPQTPPYGQRQAPPGGPPRPPQGPYGPYPPNAYGQPPFAPAGYQMRPANSMATAALTIALIGIFIPGLPFVGLGLGIGGRRRALRSGVGRGRALSAIIVSSVMIALFVLYLVLKTLPSSTSGS